MQESLTLCLLEDGVYIRAGPWGLGLLLASNAQKNVIRYKQLALKVIPSAVTGALI